MYLYSENLAKSKVKKPSKNLFLLPLALLIFPAVAAAQIVPDTSLPVNSIVSPDGNTNTITGGTRAGGNLFHSFQQFSIPTNGSAIFNNPLDIQNIITRVTGSSISNIDGLLKTQGTANFFLLNPNGIIFGANARLDVGGSFLASTAHTLKFADGSELGTTATATPPLLTISVPTGLQFGANPGKITVQGKGQSGGGEVASFESELNPLEVTKGNTLALVGGEIELDGGILQAPGGRVELTAIASGTIGLNSDFSIDVPEPTTETSISRADVLITNGAGINVIDNGSGSITINARNIDINTNSLLTAGVASDLGDIDESIKIGDISLNGTVAIAIDASRIENNVNLDSTATSGDIYISSDSFSLKNESELDTSVYGNGYAGNILVIANDSISLNDSYINSDAYNLEQNSQGVAGYISLEAKNSISIANSTITSENYEEVTTSDSKVTDGIYLSARAISLSDQTIVSTETFGTGNGGNINIDSQSFSVLGGSQVLATSNGGGNPGNIDVKASDNVLISGYSPFSKDDQGNPINGPSGLFADYKAHNDNGSSQGNITITTGNLQISDGGVLSASTTSNANGGSITVTANGAVEITGGGQILTTATDIGKAGKITINANDNVTISGISTSYDDRLNEAKTVLGDEQATNLFDIYSRRSSLQARSINASGTGSGEIDITAKSVFLNDSAQIESSSAGGNAGFISIKASDSVFLDKARINSSTSGKGNAGNIQINADEISLDNSNIFNNVKSGGEGNSEYISIQTNRLNLTNNARINSSNSGKGNAGDIQINADEISFSSSYIFNNIESGGEGNAGHISITTGNLYLENGSQIQTIVRQSLDNKPASKGNAGTININARNQIIMSGISNNFTSAIFSSVGQDTQGDAGSITITAGALSLTDAANLTVNNNGTGKAGDLIISTDFLNLNYGASLNAKSVSGNGGNITLATRAIQLRDNSQITTSATGTATPDASVNGGNITLNTNTLVALENSDISANSFDGNGGRVSLTTKGIYGTQFRDQPTDQSDITASSDLGPDFSGVVEINTPNFDPSQGLVQLQVQVLDTENQVVQACAVANNNRFIITGRGGLPPSPNDALSSDNVWIDLRDVAVGGESNLSSTSHNRTAITAQIVEAQGWTVTSDGKIVLTAQASKVTPHNSGLILPTCN